MRLSSTDTFRPYLGEDRALEAATAALDRSDADATEVYLTVRAGEYTRFAGARVHQPQDITEVQLTVRAVVEGHAARAATSSIERADRAVRIACERARELAAIGPAADPATVPAPWGEPPVLALWQPDTADWDAEARTADAGRAMRAAEAVGGAAFGMLGRAVTELAVATSGGIRRHAAATEASGSLTVKLGDGSSYWTDVSRSALRLGIGQAIETTAATARDMQGREDLPDGEYDVVLGPIAAGELLHFFGDFGFAGDLLASGVGVVASRRGQRLAAAAVTVADDATADVGLPFPFDVEGTPKRRVTFLDRGRVGEVVTDARLAARLGSAPTGHMHIAREESPRAIPANLLLEPGGDTERELIAGVGRGVYVQRFWYTRMVNPVETTITGVSRDACFAIEDGRLARPVVGKRFTESVLGALARVDGVGDELLTQPLMNVWNGAASAPALRIRGFRFGPQPARRA
jgi:PmbA protein